MKSNTHKKNIILMVDDQSGMSYLYADALERDLPEAQVISCSTIDAAKKAVKEHSENIALIFIDQDLGCGTWETHGLVDDIREGAYGKELVPLPIIVTSGFLKIHAADYPVMWMGKTEDFMDQVEAIKKLFAGDPQWDEQIKQWTMQESRDLSARVLINLLQPADSGWDGCERAAYDIDAHVQNAAPQESKKFMAERIQEMRSAFKAAFEGGAPTNNTTVRNIGLIEELIYTLDSRDKIYAPEDKDYFQYGVLIAEIREKALEELGKVDPRAAKNYTLRSNER